MSDSITKFIEALPERSKTLTDVISPKQEDWLEWIREILLDESDARWLIRRLQARHIVKLEGCV